MQVSFEFFPPKTEESFDKLVEVANKLSSYDPEYFSVTFGAGGSTQDTTLKAVSLLKSHNYDVAPHISCIGTSKERIIELLDTYKNMDIHRLVVLRGDLPSGLGAMDGDFHYASELVAFIREHSGNHFHIEVGVYPECHPQADNLQKDLKHFKIKVDAGANRAITQYFYHADAYLQLLEDCSKLNIDIPIVPGIMPITNYAQLARFSDICGAQIPRYIRKRLEGYGDDVESIKQFGIEVVTRLCERLLALGAPGLHFYTLNKSKAVSAIVENLK